ncbi:MAG: sulfite exporter TauE/SafE family protein [Desulfovibrio sp.]|nr:sulfite exporter TauE/SafE family protein [Desulfovibrio sp.]
MINDFHRFFPLFLFVVLLLVLGQSSLCFADNDKSGSAQTLQQTITNEAETGPAPATSDAAAAPAVDTHPWWFWPISLLFFCFILGIIAVMAGVGGGVLFVPLVSGFFPFHLDFVRGAGLMVALAGALAAGPGLLRRNFANLRLALPVALIASACAIVGAMLGLALPTTIVQTCLGVTILGIAVLLLLSKNSVRPVVSKQDAVGMALGMQGVFLEPSTGEVVEWKTHRTLAGLLLFIAIGIMAGMFGLGAGWANVPVLNLLMGAPLKVAVGTSKFLLSITDTSAAWVYMNQGCVIPLMAVPSIVGLMLGSVVGVRLLAIAKPKFIRYMVIGVLFFSGAKALMKGLGL